MFPSLVYVRRSDSFVIESRGANGTLIDPLTTFVRSGCVGPIVSARGVRGKRDLGKSVKYVV